MEIFLFNHIFISEETKHNRGKKMHAEIRVREAMTEDVVSVLGDTPVNEVARIMAEKNIGSVIVTENKKPVGIVTERDISYRVVARDMKPSEVQVREIMSKGLKTVTQDITLTEASKMMAKHNIRRLPVVEGENLVGIITTKDIVAIAPEQIEILRELSRMREEILEREEPDMGTCENCGDKGVELYEVNGIFICESCKEDIGA
jgi:CBS domain-containing protein